MCGLGGSGYRMSGMERKVCKRPLGNNSAILRQHCCGALWGEYVKTSSYMYLVFLCIFRLPRSVFLVGVYPVGVVLRVSLSLCKVGSVAIHCIPLPDGAVLLGHCGTFVVTLNFWCASHDWCLP